MTLCGTPRVREWPAAYFLDCGTSESLLVIRNRWHIEKSDRRERAGRLRYGQKADRTNEKQPRERAKQKHSHPAEKLSHRDNTIQSPD